MLYTVVPLERIYSNQVKSILVNSNNDDGQDTSDEYKQVELKHGRVYAKREGDGYVIDGINSTNMSDYLNPDYMPGSKLN